MFELNYSNKDFYLLIELTSSQPNLVAVATQ